MRTPLRTRTNQTIAYIAVDHRGVHTITNARHQVLGYYDPRTNRTLDRSHRTVGYGYQLPRLVPGSISEDGAGIEKPEPPMNAVEARREAERREGLQKRMQDARTSCMNKIRDLQGKLDGRN